MQGVCEIQCSKHKRYMAMNRPRVPCDCCWYNYLHKKYPGFVTNLIEATKVSKPKKEDL